MRRIRSGSVNNLNGPATGSVNDLLRDDGTPYGEFTPGNNTPQGNTLKDVIKRFGEMSTRAKVAGGLAISSVLVLITPVGDRIMDTFDPKFECQPEIVPEGSIIDDMVRKKSNNKVDPKPSVDKTISKNPGINIDNIQPGQEIDLCVQILR